MRNNNSSLDGDLTAKQVSEYADLPEPFQFYRLMLDGDHLHFGYWPEEHDDLTLEQAQVKLFELLSNQLPKPPATILDVGCGLGLSAYRLCQEGYEVTAIAPSAQLIHYAEIHYGHENIQFEVAGFLDGDECDFMSRTYDAILFQESLQYLHPLKQVFETAHQLLTSKGKVIICDEMVHDPTIEEHTAVHPRRHVVRKLLETAFQIVFQDSIGSRVQRTCTEMIQRFEKHKDRLVRTVASLDAPDRIQHYQEGWKLQKSWYRTGQMEYELITARKDRIVMRSYLKGDENLILPLFNQVFGTERSLSHWVWKFRDNPFGSYKIALADSMDRLLAAQYCGYPVPIYSTMGKKGSFLSYQIGDTMTNPAFRGVGLGKSSILARIVHYFYELFCEGQVPFVYGFNTGVIRKLGERFLGYEYISGIPYLCWNQSA